MAFFNNFVEMNVMLQIRVSLQAGSSVSSWRLDNSLSSWQLQLHDSSRHEFRKEPCTVDSITYRFDYYGTLNLKCDPKGLSV